MTRAQPIYALHRLFRPHNQPVPRARIQDKLECWPRRNNIFDWVRF